MTRRAWEQLELGRHISRATAQFIPGDTHLLAAWVCISSPEPRLSATSGLDTHTAVLG